ncbi:peptidase [Clostridium sp. MCC353]|uniref:S41 family peptidase n=1 Tax=Clostridium sp. MCC353 TaxID=2592646 RepID=UPI001C00B274|nr:S41 family peptidase [Clostridium sp. MCC353]MBT9780132.1 peptidase [Clostridium sp. MCC353]
MKWNVTANVFICTMIFTLLACSPKLSILQEKESHTEEISKAAVYESMILTKEQMLSDYDMMWKNMRESYPFWGVINRRLTAEGGDYNEIIDNYRKEILEMETEDHQSMWRYLEIISGSLYDVCGATGHVGILNPRYYREFDRNNRKYLEEMPALKAWVDIGSRTEVKEFYEYYDYLLSRLPKPEEVAPESEEEGENSQEAADDMEPNLTMKTITGPETCAYIKVNSFEDYFMEKDLPEIHAFLESVKDYDHLIIDIRENSGGNTVYWEKAFVCPNISKTVNSRLVRMMRDTELTRRFYGSEYENSFLDVQSVIHDPQFSNLPGEDTAGLALARELTVTLQPEFHEKLFKGKIWVLISPNVFSSSEAFAVFCKDTGFATLVGQPTGGSDSGGAVWYELPNRHLLITFDVEYCLNADGSCNMEAGTMPDIESDEALETVLELIGADRSS